MSVNITRDKRHDQCIRTKVPFFGALSVFVSVASTFFPNLCARLRFNGGSLSPPTNGENLVQINLQQGQEIQAKETMQNKSVSFLH